MALLDYFDTTLEKGYCLFKNTGEAESFEKDFFKFEEAFKRSFIKAFFNDSEEKRVVCQRNISLGDFNNYKRTFDGVIKASEIEIGETNLVITVHEINGNTKLVCEPFIKTPFSAPIFSKSASSLDSRFSWLRADQSTSKSLNAPWFVGFTPKDESILGDYLNMYAWFKIEYMKNISMDKNEAQAKYLGQKDYYSKKARAIKAVDKAISEARNFKNSLTQDDLAYILGWLCANTTGIYIEAADFAVDKLIEAGILVDRDNVSIVDTTSPTVGGYLKKYSFSFKININSKAAKAFTENPTDEYLAKSISKQGSNYCICSNDLGITLLDYGFKFKAGYDENDRQEICAVCLKELPESALDQFKLGFKGVEPEQSDYDKYFNNF